MTALTKARLAELQPGDSQEEVPGSSVDVPFNPTSLRVQISNRTAGGQQAGAQARQRPGTGEMQVSFDLIFDVADVGGNVLDQTKMVERFVRPQGTTPGKEAPPRVLFAWGLFQVQGTMESANIDLDFFDASGHPLRAKVSVSIKGQDPRWIYAPSQPSANAANPGGQAGASANPALGQPGAGGVSGLPAGAPGTQGMKQALDKLVQALPGESLQQLAARNGLAPSAWRALAAGVANPLQLSLGQEIGLPVSLGGGLASGVQTQGQDPARSTATLPLVSAAVASGAASGGVSGAGLAGAGGRTGGGAGSGSGGGASTRVAGLQAVQQGQAVAAQGGLAASIEGVKSQVHQQQSRQSLQAFGVAAATGSSDTESRPWGAGVPLRPRVGSGEAAPDAQWLAQRMSLRHPVTVSPQTGAGSSPSGAARSGTTARSSSSRVSAGCGCKGRRSGANTLNRTGGRNAR